MQTNITKAVLLAAGRGTRMRELTAELPKPMLPVRGKPVLQHIVEGLREAGLTDFLIVVGWRAEVVKEFFGDGSKLGVRIEYATQIEQNGTGKVVALARGFHRPRAVCSELWRHPDHDGKLSAAFARRSPARKRS